MAMSVLVQAEATRDHDQPRGELSARTHDVPSQATEIITLQRVQHERIAIHHRIVFAAKCAGGVQHDGAVLAEEIVPRALARAVSSRCKEGIQRVGRRELLRKRQTSARQLMVSKRRFHKIAPTNPSSIVSNSIGSPYLRGIKHESLCLRRIRPSARRMH